MGVNSLPKAVTRQRRDCDLNPGPSAPESSTLTTQLLTGSPQNTPIKSRDFCYRIYILMAVLLGVLQVGPSLVDCSALETPHR